MAYSKPKVQISIQEVQTICVTLNIVRKTDTKITTIRAIAKLLKVKFSDL